MRSEQPELTDGVVRLREWLESDAPAVAAACRDPLIARFIPSIPQPYTLEDAEGFIAGSRESTAAAMGASFAILDASSGTLMGSVTRHGPREGSHHASFGYWLAPGARGRGCAARALQLIVDWTLATTDAIRLDLYTDPDNLASQAVALRAGFDLEGVRRAWDLDRTGAPQDCVFYVRVRATEHR